MSHSREAELKSFKTWWICKVNPGVDLFLTLCPLVILKGNSTCLMGWDNKNCVFIASGCYTNCEIKDFYCCFAISCEQCFTIVHILFD